MQEKSRAQLLRIFLGESDRIHHQPVYEHLVYEARKAGLAGATVLKGVMGFGSTSRKIHSAKILRLSEDLPVVVEMVDTEEKIEQFLSKVDAIFEESGCGGLVTLEKANIVRYHPNSPDA